jgi:hypothetical protein
VAACLLDAAYKVVLGFQVAALGRDEAEDDHLALGNEAQGLEGAGAGVVVLQKEAVHVELVKEDLRYEVVAALRGPGGAEVAAAHVRRHGHAVGPALQGAVDGADVGLVLVLGVAAKEATCSRWRGSFR